MFEEMSETYQGGGHPKKLHIYCQWRPEDLSASIEGETPAGFGEEKQREDDDQGGSDLDAENASSERGRCHAKVH
jgi:hypothetical protein